MTKKLNHKGAIEEMKRKGIYDAWRKEPDEEIKAIMKASQERAIRAAIKQDIEKLTEQEMEARKLQKWDEALKILNKKIKLRRSLEDK